MITLNETVSELRKLQNRVHLPSMLARMNYKIIAEIGVDRGEHFTAMLGANPTMAIAVDIWRANIANSNNDQKRSQYDQDRSYENMLALQWNSPSVFVLRMFSEHAAKLFACEFFDFVYIDGDHSYEGAKADIENWWPLVRSGGMLAGHDYKRKYGCGVIRAVDEFVAREGLEDYFHVTPQKKAPSWFIVKK